MGPDRWKRIEQLYNQALERRPQERSSFLAQASAGDEELRREVESLLSRGATEFLEQPAVEVAAQAMAGDRSQLAAGGRLNHYSIVSMLGAGGMGEVYRAHDTKLKREVAIKILPKEFLRDPGRVRRFQREAEALASLNHPNIAQIYGLEESDHATGIVMELVEGATLQDRLKRGPIPVDEALDIAKQIAQALEAAHEKGVIHRDLKPANIKITLERVVKVLDFGLAKMADVSVGSSNSGSDSLTVDASMPGMILGTPAYMSPEQAKGTTLDKRTDIWAFGAVFFEMLSGRQAFRGDDNSDVLAAVLRAEP